MADIIYKTKAKNQKTKSKKGRSYFECIVTEEKQRCFSPSMKQINFQQTQRIGTISDRLYHYICTKEA